MSSFDLLPSETILNIALEVPLSSISSYCRTSRTFNDLISDNDAYACFGNLNSLKITGQ
jgi:hypothetical protein